MSDPGQPTPETDLPTTEREPTQAAPEHQGFGPELRRRLFWAGVYFGIRDDPDPAPVEKPAPRSLTGWRAPAELVPVAASVVGAAVVAGRPGEAVWAVVVWIAAAVLVSPAGDRVRERWPDFWESHFVLAVVMSMLPLSDAVGWWVALPVLAVAILPRMLMGRWLHVREARSVAPD